MHADWEPHWPELKARALCKGQLHRNRSCQHDSPAHANQPKPATQYPMTEEEIAQAGRAARTLLVWRKVGPLISLARRYAWGQKAGVWALIFLLVSKLDFGRHSGDLQKRLLTHLRTEGVPFLALGAVGLTIALMVWPAR